MIWIILGLFLGFLAVFGLVIGFSGIDGCRKLQDSVTMVAFMIFTTMAGLVLFGAVWMLKIGIRSF